MRRLLERRTYLGRHRAPEPVPKPVRVVSHTGWSQLPAPLRPVRLRPARFYTNPLERSA